MSTDKPEPMFPVLNSKLLFAVPWRLVEPMQRRAQLNHSQTLERLAERGGMSPVEIYYLLRDEPFPPGNFITEENALRYIWARIHLLDSSDKQETPKP